MTLTKKKKKKKKLRTKGLHQAFELIDKRFKVKYVTKLVRMSYLIYYNRKQKESGITII